MVCVKLNPLLHGPISLTSLISDKIGKEPAWCYKASLDNSHAFVVLPLVQQCMYKVTNAEYLKLLPWCKLTCPRAFLMPLLAPVHAVHILSAIKLNTTKRRHACTVTSNLLFWISYIKPVKALRMLVHYVKYSTQAWS